jgi:protein-tyrosine phosphatase
MSVDSALALLRAKRPIVNPNVSQVLQLREFEAHWRQKTGGG